MKSKYVFQFLILISSLLLFSCGGGGGGGGGGDDSDSVEAHDVTTVEGLAGVWDWSDDHNGVIDEWYLHFSPAGDVSDYDFQGDSFDQGPDCYIIERNWDLIIHISGNTFQANSVGQFTARIDSSGNLVLTDLSGIEGIFPATDLDVSDLQSDCSSPRSSTRRPLKSKFIFQ